MDDVKASKLHAFLIRRMFFLEPLGEYALFLLEIFKATLKSPPKFSLFLTQLFEIGVASLPVVAITGFFTGLVLAAQSFYQLADKGLAGVTGLMVGKAMVTELGPVLTAFMITGRVGASVCAELGSMKVTEQIDALETMSVNPHSYLVAPRFFAGMFIMPFLTIFSMALGILGGYLISVFYFGITTSSYFDPIPFHMSPFDILTGLIKAFTFGFIILSISCFKGMKTKQGAAGVGQSTTQSVVICYCFILLTNFLITILLNILHSQFYKDP